VKRVVLIVRVSTEIRLLHLLLEKWDPTAQMQE
jgi:hypothetical protein